jgi:hypothetical protein
MCVCLETMVFGLKSQNKPFQTHSEFLARFVSLTECSVRSLKSRGGWKRRKDGTMGRDLAFWIICGSSHDGLRFRRSPSRGIEYRGQVDLHHDIGIGRRTSERNFPFPRHPPPPNKYLLMMTMIIIWISIQPWQSGSELGSGNGLSELWGVGGDSLDFLW